MLQQTLSILFSLFNYLVAVTILGAYVVSILNYNCNLSYPILDIELGEIVDKLDIDTTFRLAKVAQKFNISIVLTYSQELVKFISRVYDLGKQIIEQIQEGLKYLFKDSSNYKAFNIFTSKIEGILVSCTRSLTICIS